MNDLHKQQAQFAEDVSRLIDYIFSQGYTCSLGEAWRSQEQAEWYAQKGLGIKDSLHCKRLAIDLNVFDPSGNLMTNGHDYERFGCFWEGLDAKNRWGGRFKTRVDGNHFEREEA